VGDTIPKKYVGLPVAKVELKDETFNTTDYIAPMISVPLQSPLGEMCANVAKRLREKAVFLSEKAKSPALASEAAALIELKELIKTIVLGLPYLEACLNTGVSHPFQLYLGLSLVAGELSSLSPSMLPPLVSPYNHNEIRASFDQLREFVLKMLDQIHEAYNAVSFTFEDGRFGLPYLEVWKRTRLTIGVRTNIGQTDADTAHWFEQSLIASAGRIPSLVTRRILGAPRRRIERDAELGLVSSAGLLLYSVTADPQLIEIGEVLQIFNPDAGEARRPADVLLYVKP
jgi:type VI secretion system protein ImpJ